MDKSLLVQVFVPTFDGKGKDGGGRVGVFGTGYPVARDIILTARHVIEQQDRDTHYPIAVFWHHYPNAGPSEGWFDLAPKDVIWKGKGDIDGALLRCPRPREAGPYFGLLTAEPPPQDARWSSAGFPSATKREGCREPASFGGRMHSMARQWHRFELDVDVPPSKEEDWKGASGMPIFGHGGTRIFGLAREVPRKFDSKKLHALPACKLLEDDDFKKLIGYADQRNRRKSFEDRLTKIFRKSEAAIDLIRKYGTLLRDDDVVPDEEAASAACALLDRRIEEVITGLADVHDKILQESQYENNDDLTTAGRVILQALRLIVSFLFDHGVASGVRNHILNPAAALLAIPCVTPTVAEIVMAAAQDRAAEFRPIGERTLAGTRQLPHPPEAGIGGSKGNSEEIRQSLMGKFVPRSWPGIRSGIDDFMIRKFGPSTDGLDRTREQLVTLAAIQLGHESRNNRYYMVYRLPKDAGARRELEEGLGQLKKAYAPLVFLGLTDDFEVEAAETEVYGPLHVLFRDKPKQEEKVPSRKR